MSLRVRPSPVTHQHGRTTTTTATKASMMPHPPDSYHSSTYRRRITPQATQHALGSTYSKPRGYYSSGLGSPSTTSRDAFRTHRPDITRRNTGPLVAKYEPKHYSEDTSTKLYSTKYASQNRLSERTSGTISSLANDMLRLPYMDDASSSSSRTYKNSNFGTVTENLYKSSIEDLNAPRPRDSCESRTSSANGTAEARDAYRRESMTRPINGHSSYSTLKRTPSIVKLSQRRSSFNDFTSRSTAAEYGLGATQGPGKRGLSNIGNTCYMNTVVQCLSSIPDLSKYCLHMDSLMRGHVNSNSYHSGKLFQVFAETVKKLWDAESRDSHYTPYNLKRQIGNMLSHEFRGYGQHDAAEFLLSLLAELSEDVNRVKNPPRLGAMPENLNPAALANLTWRRQEQLTQSIIFELFNGLTRSTLRCSTCDYVSVTFELFYDLSVPIPSRSRNPSLADALELYTKPETLSGENQFRCDKCKTLRSGTKKMEIERCPKVLIIQLKRFSSSHSGMTRKVDTLVDFPLRGLDLSKYMSEDASRISSRYELQAVCNHYGGTAGGHYIAYCKHNQDNQWYKYDDSRVSQLKESSIVTANAYVLLYIAQSRLSHVDSHL
ncbi:ubiquitin carboxyl-terminal hydrolase 2-like [Diadema antillarum]|uniref:ubiquitin carboxyl-terminal hydrolase 2-like n=1 Tax=Diadema antillarum TaxID=105358 RepID=UPI003A8B0FE0